MGKHDIDNTTATYVHQTFDDILVVDGDTRTPKRTSITPHYRDIDQNHGPTTITVNDVPVTAEALKWPIIPSSLVAWPEIPLEVRIALGQSLGHAVTTSHLLYASDSDSKFGGSACRGTPNTYPYQRPLYPSQQTDLLAQDGEIPRPQGLFNCLMSLGQGRSKTSSEVHRYSPLSPIKSSAVQLMKTHIMAVCKMSKFHTY